VSQRGFRHQINDYPVAVETLITNESIKYYQIQNLFAAFDEKYKKTSYFIEIKDRLFLIQKLYVFQPIKGNKQFLT
jgi:hypothetical protein